MDATGSMAVLTAVKVSIYRAGLGGLLVAIASVQLAFAQIEPLNCEQASNFVEKTICSNPKLIELDRNLFQEIERASQEPKIPAQLLELTQQNWSKQRNQCKNTACIEMSYQQRIQESKNLNAMNQEFVHYFIRTKNDKPDPQLALLQLQFLDEKRVRVLAQTFWINPQGGLHQSTDFSGYANQGKRITVKDLDSKCVLKLRQYADYWQVWQDSPLCGNKNLRFSGRYNLQK